MGLTWAEEGEWYVCRTDGCKKFAAERGEACRHYSEDPSKGGHGIKGRAIKPDQKVKLVKDAYIRQLVGDEYFQRRLKERPKGERSELKKAKCAATKAEKKAARLAAQVQANKTSTSEDDADNALEGAGSGGSALPTPGSNLNQHTQGPAQRSQNAPTTRSSSQVSQAGALPMYSFVPLPVTDMPNVPGLSIDDVEDTVMNDVEPEDFTGSHDEAGKQDESGNADGSGNHDGPAELMEVDGDSAKIAYQTCLRTLLGMPREIRQIIIEYSFVRGMQRRDKSTSRVLDTTLLRVCRDLRFDGLDVLRSRMTIIQIVVHSQHMALMEDLVNWVRALSVLRMDHQLNENRYLTELIPSVTMDVHLKKAEPEPAPAEARLDTFGQHAYFGGLRLPDASSDLDSDSDSEDEADPPMPDIHIPLNFKFATEAWLDLIEHLQLTAADGVLERLHVTFGNHSMIPSQRNNALTALWSLGILRNVGGGDVGNVGIHSKAPWCDELHEPARQNAIQPAIRRLRRLMVSHKRGTPGKNRPEMEERMEEAIKKLRRHFRAPSVKKDLEGAYGVLNALKRYWTY
ncbi:uncharacterized protein AB675_8700 [Cyphellophora attinorum]|uniref:Uncharacterized protein n=1 Tax=Cyphellophora attinorum TaxID=1664694 RepID=A0A0N1P112_9EURO|nr:uncharacterized protein AB675_8700 [Phialophora attinorum]KPI44425.1 hypothetical protein AB675_8700 [Phialophora attinorum]